MRCWFNAHEFYVGTMLPTGQVEHYLSNNIDSAVEECLYMRKLSDGKAFVGPSGRVVYSGASGWSVIPE